MYALQVKGIFGFTTDDNIGKIAFPAVQVLPAMPPVFHDTCSTCSKSITLMGRGLPGCVHEDWQLLCQYAAPHLARCLGGVWLLTSLLWRPCCLCPSLPAGRPLLPRLLSTHVWRPQGREVRGRVPSICAPAKREREKTSFCALTSSGAIPAQVTRAPASGDLPLWPGLPLMAQFHANYANAHSMIQGRHDSSHGTLDESQVPHPLRHRPGPLLPHDARCGATHGAPQASAHRVAILPGTTGTCHCLLS